ncbi:MAG TPA: TIGR04222 domain-containing membrane protein, partial [Actinomycetes bacterium]|nr:TIGR04222 domain-containing membrane protein [Actinomycetes bacterium]
AHPVEWAAYQAVATHPQRTLGELQAALGREPAVAAVRERLRLGGLVPTPEQRARYRAAGLWFVPLLALGAARVAAGSANGRPVGFLVGLLVITVVVAAVLVLRVPDATELGRRTLRRLRAETRRPTVGASPAELGMATALFGAGVLWRADVETALALRIPREHGAVLGGIGDGGGGGSCGGGGGCGGGCGG